MRSCMSRAPGGESWRPCPYLVELPLAAAAIWLAVVLTRGTGRGPAYRVSALSAAPAYSSAARQQYQAATDR